MKRQSHVVNSSLKAVFLLIFAGLLIASTGTLANVRAQQTKEPQRLILVSAEDGFNGTFNVGGKTYSIENRVSKSSHLTKIVEPGGRVIVESSQEGAIISVALPSGKLIINSAAPGPFSPAETNSLKAFAQSADCEVVKKIVAEVFKQRAGEMRPFLDGFRVIAMFLGE